MSIISDDETSNLIEAILDSTPVDEEDLEEFIEVLAELGIFTADQFSSSLVSVNENSEWFKNYTFENMRAIESKFNMKAQNFDGWHYWFANDQDAKRARESIAEYDKQILEEKRQER